MKLTILQSDLLPALQAVSRSIGVRSSLPVLGNVLLGTDAGQLKLSATNLEIGVIKKISAQVADDGEVTVPAKTFLELVTSLSGVKIELESDGEQLKISAPHFSANLNGIPASEFPEIPLSSERSLTLSGKLLVESLPQISFSAAADDGRPILTGILTEINGGMLELVATDGFRLAHKKAEVKISSSAKVFKALIPKRTFEEVVRLINEELKEEDQPIEISTSENQNQIIFSIGDTKLSSRLIEGQFPAWEKIIPESFVNKTIVDRGELAKAVKVASVFSRTDNANIVKLQVLPNLIKISSQARELGEQISEVEAKTEGEEVTIAFNSKFLNDSLQNVDSAQIIMQFSGNLSPALVRPIEDNGLEHIIMPVRLS